MTQARDLADGKFDTDTLVVSASNDRVGVNNASPDTTMKVNFSSASTAGFGINDTNSGNLGGMLQFYSGSSNGTLRANIMNANNAGVHAALGTGGTVVFGGTSYTAANALDDYEEGTWTPAFTSSGATFSHSTQLGAYTKIGRFVHLVYEIALNANPTGTTTNAVKLDNLPFTAGGISGFYGGAIGYYFNVNVNNSARELVYQLSNGATEAEYKQSGDAQGEINLLANSLENGSKIRGSMTYFQN